MNTGTTSAAALHDLRATLLKRKGEALFAANRAFETGNETLYDSQVVAVAKLDQLLLKLETYVKAQELHLNVLLYCLPDNFDPRGPKQ